MNQVLMNAASTPAGRVDGQGRRRARHAARQLTAACGLLLLLGLAACEEGVAPATTPPPGGSQGAVVVTVAAVADAVFGGDPLSFRVSAKPAPRAALTVMVTIASPGCDLGQSPESVTIAAGKTDATLTVPTTGVTVGANGCVVTATVAAGTGYVGAAAGASASTILTIHPVVTVTADSASVTEGSRVSFTLTASPPPASDLTVNVRLSEAGSFLAAGSPRAVTIRASERTAALTAATVDDGADEPDGSVTVTVETGSGYTVGSPDSATVAVSDNDTTGTTSPGGGGLAPTTPPSPPSGLPEVGINSKTEAGTLVEGENMRLQLWANPAPASSLTVNLQWTGATNRVSNPPTTVTIPRKTDQAAFHEFSVGTVENTDQDGDEAVLITVVDGSGYEVVDTDSRKVYITIQDDDD